MSRGYSIKHELKLWPEFYEAVDRRDKTFELRRDDREFEEGDALWLRHWNPQTGKYNGRSMGATVTYIHRGRFLQPGVVCMAIRVDVRGYNPNRDETL